MKNIEVEVKYFLPDPERLISFLDEHGKREKVKEYQKDTYFTPAHENFIAQKPTVDKRLRTRKSDKGEFINFKHRHNNGSNEGISCDEIETTVGEVSQIENIFERLGIKKLIVVEKERTTYLYQDTEIALDKITGLGWFIEIESKGDFKTIEEAKKQVFVVAKDLGVDKYTQDKRGYPYLLLEKDGLI